MRASSTTTWAQCSLCWRGTRQRPCSPPPTPVARSTCGAETLGANPVRANIWPVNLRSIITTLRDIVARSTGVEGAALLKALSCAWGRAWGSDAGSRGPGARRIPSAAPSGVGRACVCRVKYRIKKRKRRGQKHSTDPRTVRPTLKVKYLFLERRCINKGKAVRFIYGFKVCALCRSAGSAVAEAVKCFTVASRGGPLHY